MSKLKWVLIVVILANAFVCVGERSMDVRIISIDEGQEASKKIGFAYSLDEQKRAKFEEFAVNNNGDYAVLMRAFTAFITVNVYDSSGNFMFSYKFRTGQHVLLFWKGDILGIYLCKSKRILYYDRQGDLAECFELLDTQGSRDFILETIEAHRVEKDDGIAYYASNNGINEDSRREKMFLLKDDGADVTILYKADGGSVYRLITVVVVVIVAAVVIFIRKKAWCHSQLDHHQKSGHGKE